MAGIFSWLRKKLLTPSPLSRWTVRLLNGDSVTSDGRGEERTLPLRQLRRVVVATDDSGLWGADVVFLLYSNAPDPVGIFPLEADGRGDFVKWLAAQPGFKDRELAKAMSSTRVARFDIMVTKPKGS